MVLPIPSPLMPMLAKRIDEVPSGPGLFYEPKWDGFRTIVFRDGEELILQSRDQKPMGRYFPELMEPLLRSLPERCALDGEIVIAKDQSLDFEALQMRIHPAASRVKLLSQEIPASIVFWDLLALGDRSLLSVPFEARRAELETVLRDVAPPLAKTPITDDPKVAAEWFHRFEGAGLDGIMAKPKAGLYEPNKRSMFKVKHDRTCDAVVAGFRWHKDGPETHVGSLLLGLYRDGVLHSVGVASSFSEAKRRELTELTAPLRTGADDHPWREWIPGDEARRPDQKSRWTGGKDLSWVPLRLELVAEVAYDHMQGSRFRHTTQLKRLRTDKPPADCTYAQLEVAAPYELEAIFRRS